MTAWFFPDEYDYDEYEVVDYPPACLSCGCPVEGHDAREKCSHCGSTCALEAAA